LGYWASGSGGGYEEHEYYLILMLDNGSDEGHDDIASRVFDMGKATPNDNMYGLERKSRYVMGNDTKEDIKSGFLITLW